MGLDKIAGVMDLSYKNLLVTRSKKSTPYGLEVLFLLTTSPKLSYNENIMIQQTTQQFTGAVSISWGTVGVSAIFTTALIKFSAAPTSAENITITFKSGKGSDFDTVIYQLDPSTNSETDIIYSPDVALPLNKGDAVELTYLNTDARTVSVILKGLDSSDF